MSDQRIKDLLGEAIAKNPDHFKNWELEQWFRDWRMRLIGAINDAAEPDDDEEEPTDERVDCTCDLCWRMARARDGEAINLTDDEMKHIETHVYPSEMPRP